MLLYNKETMIRSKTIFLLAILVIILIIILIVQSLIRTTGPQEPPLKKSPIPQSSSGFLSKPPFKVLSNDLSLPVGIRDSVQIGFEKPVDGESLALEIEPYEDTVLTFDPSATFLTIEPAKSWKYDTEYKIKIYSETLSKEGSTLDQNYTIHFKTKPYIGI